jgi:hypothetical protein
MDRTIPAAIWLRSLEGQIFQVAAMFVTLCLSSWALLGPRVLPL